MKAKTVMSGLAISALFVTGLVSVGTADTWNKKTIVSFPESVELPGNVVVPAGKYVFKLADSNSNRHIVQVMSEAEDKVHATILAIPSQRQEPAEKTVLTFYETPKEQPMFIQKWYYPGDTIGHEFAYPKDRASYIAKTANTNVLMAPGEESGEIGTYVTPDNREIARSDSDKDGKLGQAADKTEDAVAKAADATERGVEKAADKTEDAVTKAADATERGVEKAADKTEDAVTKSADGTERGVEKAASETEKAADKSADKVERTADAAIDDKDAADRRAAAEAARADDPAAAPVAQAEPPAAQADPVAQPAPTTPAPRTDTMADARSAADQDADALPQTASFLPLIGLSGLGLIGAASLLRLRRRR